MASGAWTIPNKSLLNTVNATYLLSLTTTNYRAVLLTSSFTPNDTTNELYGDLTNELSTANGYTNGGAALPSLAFTPSGATITFTSNPVVWTASGGSIPAWRYCYIYYLGTANSKTNPLVCHFVGDSTPADVPATTSGNTLTITMNGSGIIAVTKTP